MKYVWVFVCFLLNNSNQLQRLLDIKPWLTKRKNKKGSAFRSTQKLDAEHPTHGERQVRIN